MEQDIVFGLCVGLAVFAIVGETITEKFPSKSFSKWWRKNVVHQEEGNKNQGC